MLKKKQGRGKETWVGLPRHELACGDLIGVLRARRRSDKIDVDSLFPLATAQNLDDIIHSIGN